MLEGNLNRIDGQKLMSSFSHFYHKNLILGILAIGYFFFVGTLSIPARLFLRKKMGERAFSISSFLFSTLLYFALILLLAAIALLSVPETYFDAFPGSAWLIPDFLWVIILFICSPITGFLFVLSARAVCHFKFHLRRARNNIIGYSYYRGEGRYFEHRRGKKIFGFLIDETILRMLVEPFGLFKINLLMFVLCIISILFRVLDASTGLPFYLMDTIIIGTLAVAVMMMISSSALFVEEYILMNKARTAILDMVDGELDMQRVLAFKNKLKIELPKNLDEHGMTNI
jgi:hypothetical protein